MTANIAAQTNQKVGWGFASFVGSDGKTRSLMMTWSNHYTDSRKRLLAKPGKPYIAPKIPDHFRKSHGGSSRIYTIPS